MSSNYTNDSFKDFLPIYYKRLFPCNLFYRWLSYGNLKKYYFANREFSLTLDEDIYLRYRSYMTCADFAKEIQDKCPSKIDIGAVFNSKPKDHNTNTSFKPLERELVFDIDMTDYDDIRYCCNGADICKKCWTFMTIAMQIIDKCLREDFGFQHLLWVYSGRRGIHCWVADELARQLTSRGRSSIVQYLTVITSNLNNRKKMQFNDLDHPSIERAIETIEKYFYNLHVVDQDFLKDAERWTKVISLIPDESLCNTLEKEMENNCNNSSDRWKAIENAISSAEKGANGALLANTIKGIKLYFCYPRLDVNVSKGLNHLLKSPFCVHPKTGRVCVPIDIEHLATFNPFSVPTIGQLIDEINIHDATLKETIMDVASSEIKKIKDFKKTSMNQSIEVFKDFVKGLEKSWSGKRLEKSDKSCDF